MEREVVIILRRIFYSAVLSDRKHFFFFQTLQELFCFPKKWDPRAVKPFLLKPNSEENEIFNGNSMELIPKIDTDILYLDHHHPQHAPNYHDNPVIKGDKIIKTYRKKIQNINICF